MSDHIVSLFIFKFSVTIHRYLDIYNCLLFYYLAEKEMKRTQKNKATEYHCGLLRAKLAKLRSQAAEGESKAGGGKGEGFDV